MAQKTVKGTGALNAAEKRLVAAAKAGTVLELSAQDTVRATVIRALVCAERQDWPVAPEGVRLSGGRVEGRLELADRELLRPLWLRACVIPEGLDVSDARTRALDFEDAVIGSDESSNAIFASGVHIQADLRLDGASINGEFYIPDATIAGQMSANRARFVNAGSDAVIAHGLSCAGVFFDDALVEGHFNIAGVTVTGQLNANRARFTNAGGDAVIAHGLSCAGVFFDDALVEGHFTIAGATVNGQLSAGRAHFINSGGDSVIAQGLSCAVLFLDESVIEGHFNLASATITGHLSANRTRFTNTNGDAVVAHGMSCAGAFFRDAVVDGRFSISGARIGGQFSASRARFTNTGDDAVIAQDMSCIGAFLDDAVIVGCFTINGMTITGQFSANRTRFANPGGDALVAQAMSCIGMFLDDAVVEGRFAINYATIAGQFSACGTRFDNPYGAAIVADRAHFGSVFMRPSRADDGSKKSTEIIGIVKLVLAQIDSDFDIEDAQLHAGYHAAILARGIRVAGTLSIASGTRIDGVVTLRDADIGRFLVTNSRLCAAVWARERVLDQGPLAAVPGTPDPFSTLQWTHHALDLSEARIGRLIMPETAESRPIGIVDLSRARVGTLTDFQAAWPAPIDRAARRCEGRLCDENGNDADHLILDGFEYEHLDNPDGRSGQRDGSAESIVAARKRWLMAQSRGDLFESFRPQPWRQLAKVLAAHGHEEEAREIAIERRVMQRLASDMPWFRRAVSSTLHFLADYGFNPWKTVAWSGMVILIFAALYGGAALAYCDGKPLCADERVFVRVLAADFVPAESDKAQAALTLYKNYPRFDPLLYSFDTFLPLLDAGSEKYWRVNSRTVLGKVLYYLTVLEQIVGALLVSLIVTGFTGLLTRDEK